MVGTDIAVHPIHLGRGARAVAEPEVTRSLSWYEAYAQRHSGDGAEGRLVAMHTFTESWQGWEVHPHGSEVVLCTAGALTLHQERPDGTKVSVSLGAGQYAINDPGTWHTADVEDRATVIFITAGWGTQHRPR